MGHKGGKTKTSGTWEYDPNLKIEGADPVDFTVRKATGFPYSRRRAPVAQRVGRTAVFFSGTFFLGQKGGASC